MISQILYLCLSPHTAAAVQARYHRHEVRCVALRSMAGHRGDVVVIEPLPLDASETEREQYAEYLKCAVTHTRLVGTPLIIGEVQ